LGWGGKKGNILTYVPPDTQRGKKEWNRKGEAKTISRGRDPKQKNEKREGIGCTVADLVDLSLGMTKKKRGGKKKKPVERRRWGPSECMFERKVQKRKRGPKKPMDKKYAGGRLRTPKRGRTRRGGVELPGFSAQRREKKKEFLMVITPQTRRRGGAAQKGNHRWSTFTFDK